MASNGSTSIAVTAYNTLKFNWSQVGQNTPNNYTVVNWSLQLVAGTAGQIISSAQKAWSVTINGDIYSGTNSVAIGNNATTTLASGQVTIYHNQDGSKSFSYSFSQEFNITFAGASIGTKTGSGTGVLNTIPRATTPVPHATTVDMGTTLTIYTYRASTEFTHNLEYSFAGSPYNVIENDVDTVAYWSIPLSLASSIPNTTSGTMTIRCTTKKGSTVIGTSTALLTVKVPTTVIPSIGTVSLTEANTGAIATIGAYVQNKSRLKVAITASGANGSTIQSYTSTFEGKSYTGSNFTTDTVSGSGTVRIITTVTDSRGRTASKTTDVTVLSYSSPAISSLHVARYNSSGIADPNGAYASIKLAYSVTPLGNKNTASAKIEYKRTTATTWTTLRTETALSANVTINPTTTFSTDYQWDFRVTLTDAFNSASPAVYSTYLPSGAVILDIKADGKGIAFFKTSTKAGVEIAGELPGSAISLTTNANLNSLTTPGFYVIPTTTISASITNKPYTDTATASIRVEKTGDSTLKQILQKSTKDDGVIYERGYESSSWGAWSVVYAGAGKILWTGNYVLNASQTVTFSEKVSLQQHGIVLVFSRYATTGEQNYAFSCHFISKLLVSAVGGTTGSVNMNLIMGTTKFDYIAGKTVTISDTSITGHADNTATGKADISGISYYNDKFALRYVIGV